MPSALPSAPEQSWRSSSPPSSAAMRVIFDGAPQPDARLLVMLPAAKARPEDFIEHGFIAAVRRRSLALDVAALDAHADLYLDGDIAERLEEVIGPLRRRYAETCLLGISLGGMGSIAYACRHGRAVGKLMLLAPFLGLRGAGGSSVRTSPGCPTRPPGAARSR